MVQLLLDGEELMLGVWKIVGFIMLGACSSVLAPSSDALCY